MADCFIIRHHNFKSEPKIIYNLPLQESLDDISGYNRTTTYSGDTTLSITADDGLYLYNGRIKLDTEVFNDIIDNCFTIEFDVKINSNGTSKNPQYRRVMQTYNTVWMFFEIGYIGSKTTNKFTLAESGSTDIYSTSNTYDDGKYHHVIINYNLSSRVITAVIDNTETLTNIMSSDSIIKSLHFGDNSYGLNGYIKNLIITTGGE